MCVVNVRRLKALRLKCTQNILHETFLKRKSIESYSEKCQPGFSLLNSIITSSMLSTASPSRWTLIAHSVYFEKLCTKTFTGILIFFDKFNNFTLVKEERGESGPKVQHHDTSTVVNIILEPRNILMCLNNIDDWCARVISIVF